MSKESALASMTSAVAPPVVTDQSPGLSVVPDAQPQKELESTRFSHLAKKESELVRQREEMKREREQLSKERENYGEAIKRIQEFERLKETDKIQAIKALGFDDTDLFNYFAAVDESNKDPATQAAKAAQAEIKKFHDEMAAKQAEEAKKQTDAVINRFKSDINKTVTSDPEKYEYCNHYGPIAEDLIYETVAAVLEESKEVISTKEAADLVESYYEEQDKAMNALKKRKPSEAAQEAKEKIEELKASQEPAKTLTNKVTASVASTITRKETPDQKRKRLMERLRTGS